MVCGLTVNKTEQEEEEEEEIRKRRTRAIRRGISENVSHITLLNPKTKKGHLYS